jgi:bifunctional non-homologous end joining protein LigD
VLPIAVAAAAAPIAAALILLAAGASGALALRHAALAVALALPLTLLITLTLPATLTLLTTLILLATLALIVLLSALTLITCVVCHGRSFAVVKEQTHDRSGFPDVSSRRPRARAMTRVAGVAISHPDRLIYPELNFSKLQLARYFEDIGKWILPHVAGRPLTLVHCPAGLAAPCTYLKHAKAWGPKALRRVKIQEKTKVGEYVVADSVEGVISLAQMGIVEIHTWNSTTDAVERPNRIVWDLDPGPAVTWKQVVTAARLVRDVLGTLGLKSWVKTTGGRGLHVVVPLTRQRGVSECLQFSRNVADAIVRTDARLYTTTFAKSGRERKILIDYLRNNRTNTTICAFSPRARPGARVSVPIPWSHLSADPGRWTLTTVLRYLRRLRVDPWADYWAAAQDIREESFAAVRSVRS